MGIGAKRPPSLKSFTHILHWRKLRTVSYTLSKHISRDTPLELCWFEHFSREISNLCCIRECECRLHFNTCYLDLLTFFQSSNVVLVKMVEFVMMSAKLGTLSLLKTQMSWNKGCDVKSFVCDVPRKIFPIHSNYFVDVIMWYVW